MGVVFSRAKVTTHEGGTNSVQEYTGANDTILTPLIGITKIANDGQAQKVSIPYISTTTTGSETSVDYKTILQPIGQEGWIVKLQCTLKSTSLNNEVDSWQGVDTGQILLVRTNKCDEDGAHDSTRSPYSALPMQSLWYIDKITISAIKGSVNMARMEMSLVRCWLA